MKEGAAATKKSISPGKARLVGARSLPHRKSYDIAVFFSMLHYFCIVVTVTALVAFFMEPSQLATKLIAYGLVFAAVTWFIALFKRRATHCPLCKGTPLVCSGALTHSKAYRLFPFNHGVTATLSIIATQRFRCMYCGSDFDLLKPPSHRLAGGKAGYYDLEADLKVKR